YPVLPTASRRQPHARRARGPAGTEAEGRAAFRPVVFDLAVVRLRRGSTTARGASIPQARESQVQSANRRVTLPVSVRQSPDRARCWWVRLIVENHGGPHYGIGYDFDFRQQLLAAQGYGDRVRAPTLFMH